MSAVRDLAGRAYAAAFARPGRAAQAVNHALFHLALRGMGYNNGWELDRSGEAWFIHHALEDIAHPLVIDVGANRGDYTRAALAVHDGVTVVAFEPLPACQAQLDQLAGQLLVMPCAVGATGGTATLRYGAPDSEWASLADLLPDYAATAATHELDVPVVTLDEILHSWHVEGQYPPIDLLKIDVEGWEHDVLAGAQRLIGDRPPTWIQIEWNLHQLLAGHTLHGLADLLPGYRAYQLLPGRRGLRPVDLRRPEPNVYGYANFVFHRGPEPA